eukprot:5534741-Amphidinium_carterae.1
MFGLEGGFFANPKPKTRKSGSGYPTLATLQANFSSAGLSSTPTLGTSSGFTQNATPPSVGSQGATPMAACVHVTQTSVSLQDLRKVKTTLPTLTFNKSSAFQLVRFWKEWSLKVGLHMGAWHPEATWTGRVWIYSFLKLEVVNTIETDLAQPKTLAKCLSKLRTSARLSDSARNR